jgi:GNAT superfamily N-acetyltransferase
MNEPAMPSLAIARVTHQDHSDWLRLFQEWHHYQSGTVTTEEKARAWQMLCDPGSSLFGLIGRTDDGTAVGLAHASRTPHPWSGGPILFLNDLFITASMRGRGLGAEMLKAVYELADEVGASQVFWLVDERDEPLQRFYERYAVRTRYVRFMRHEWPWFAPGTH